MTHAGVYYILGTNTLTAHFNLTVTSDSLLKDCSQVTLGPCACATLDSQHT